MGGKVECLSQLDTPAMGRVPMPQQDTGERKLPPQGPPWRAGGPATLRVLILALLWRGSLSQPPGFTLTVPQSVSVQEGLCVLVPCTFMYPASYDTDNPSARLYGRWYKEPATGGQDPPVASSGTSLGVSQETQGRFRLTGDPARGDCSLQISDARRTDAGRYFLYIEKGLLDHTYRSNSDGSDSALTISVPGLTEEPDIQILPAWGLPGTLLAGKPVTVTCTAPGRCSGPPPRVTWTGPFSDTAQNVSAQLANGTWAHSSALSFTPGLGDHGKELVCTVTYRPPRGPSTHRTVRLHVGYPPWPPNITGTQTRNGRPSERPRYSPRLGTGLNSSCQRQGPSISCSCSLRSHPPPQLQWQVDGEPLAGNGSQGGLQVSSWVQGDESVSTLSWTESADGGHQIFCLGSNLHGFYILPLSPLETGGLTRALIEISCKLVFVVTGFFLAYYLTLLYYRRTLCCSHESRRKDRPGDRESTVPEFGV
ncbi:sialic acid-binding Ig-like lectin 12 [Mauremys reevesii]|uniref:sialic acid-binding Ig-like lectin 12 n=1 Tax=Mauremys reevesii TaxID=260615 RepID=UPI00193FAF3D|nr:sialic acid-binding Ig-like lectin 12 [Mauremys reevesii]